MIRPGPEAAMAESERPGKGPGAGEDRPRDDVDFASKQAETSPVVPTPIDVPPAEPKRLGEFEIIARLGRGGMGEVWRARDRRLQREVALKVLPTSAVADEGARARLLREARLASKLNHPHVCTIYEVGEAEGQTYIAMELVAGQTLSERLSEGRLAVEEAVRLGQQMADALSHAHAHGVVHRDFKSLNVILTPEGRVKVLDFGLAKRLVGEELEATGTLTETALTEPWVVVGTLPYMAPEQLQGRLADARSDVWALGVVLHEMVGGSRPFQGSTAFEVSSAILHQPPRPLPASVPPPLGAIIERCLAKDPAQRYQRAAEVRSALEALQAGSRPAFWPAWRSMLVAHRRLAVGVALVGVVGLVLAIVLGLDIGGARTRLLGPGAGSGRPIRMAVLPFANLSGDPEQEYLGDGLTQEMITRLGRLHPEGLSVIARSSVMRYKGGDTPVDQIGRELHVDYVLEGSAQREANRVRVAAELIQVADQTQIWADTFEHELSGILVLQSEVAEQVAGALALKLLPAEQGRLTSARAVNPEAYDAYLKGSYHWKKLTPEGLDTAQRYFELALQKDPDYAPAYEGLAIVWGAREQMGITPPEEAGPKSMAAALKAVELDDRSAEAHEALAIAKTWREWDWAGAWSEWQRTLELNPNGANAHAYYAHFLAITGHIDEAVGHSERALELDPFNATFQALYGVPLIYQRRFDDALAATRAALAMQPDNPVGLGVHWWAASRKGLYDEAFEAIKSGMIVCYADPEVEEAMDRGWARGGYTEAMAKAAAAMESRFRTAFALPSDIANFHIEAGELDQALDWLDRGFEIHDPALPYLGAPLYDPLRSDPRFKDLLRRMNLPLLPDQPLDLGDPRG